MNPKYRILHQHEMTISSEKQTCRATSFSFHLTYMFTTAFLLIVSSGGRGGGGGGVAGSCRPFEGSPRPHFFFSYLFNILYFICWVRKPYTFLGQWPEAHLLSATLHILCLSKCCLPVTIDERHASTTGSSTNPGLLDSTLSHPVHIKRK